MFLKEVYWARWIIHHGLAQGIMFNLGNETIRATLTKIVLFQAMRMKNWPWSPRSRRVIRDIVHFFLDPIYVNKVKIHERYSDLWLGSWFEQDPANLLLWFLDTNDHSKIAIFDAAGNRIELRPATNVFANNWVPVKTSSQSKVLIDSRKTVFSEETDNANSTSRGS